jgi:urease alpha subunit
MQASSEKLGLKALIQEIWELVKAQIEAEEGSIAELGPSGLRDAEEGASLHTEDGAYAEAERDWYNSTTGEGVEQATLSTYGEE